MKNRIHESEKLKKYQLDVIDCKKQDYIEKHANKLQAELHIMKDYLLMCARKEDWHGVMDAAVDIREIVAKLSILTRSERGGLLKVSAL